MARPVIDGLDSFFPCHVGFVFHAHNPHCFIQVLILLRLPTRFGEDVSSPAATALRSPLPTSAACSCRDATLKGNAEVDRISSFIKCPLFMRRYGRAGRNPSRVFADAP